MKSTLTCIVVLMVFIPSVFAGDYPRHTDPSSLVTVEPDPVWLFMLFHNLFDGMILENITLQAEWFDWIDEVYSVPDLDLLLEMYRDQLLELSLDLKDTKFYLNQAVAFIGEFDLDSAQISFFNGVTALQASKQSLPVLEASTVQLGERLRANPEMLLQDIDALRLLIEDYSFFANTLFAYAEGEPLSKDGIEKLKEILAGVIDEGYLEDIGDSGTIFNPLQLGRTQLELNVFPNSVTVGESIVVSGRLSSSNVGLEGKRVSVSIGDRKVSLGTDPEGAFNGSITVPYIYENVALVQCFYWPKGNDVQMYSPSSDYYEIERVFFTPDIEFQYSEAYPGLLWNVSGRLSLDGVGVGGLTVVSSIDGRSRSVVSDGTGYFDVGVRIDPASDGGVVASVVSLPNKVYAGIEQSFPVEMSYYPLVFRVDASSWVFSGGSAALNFWVESNGVPLDWCVIKVRGEEDEVSYSDGGYSLVNLYTEVGRETGGSNYWVTANPAEPWIESGSLSGEFYVFNSLMVIGATLVAGLAMYYHNKFIQRKEDSLSEPIISVVDPAPMEVEPIATGFSGIYNGVLRFIRIITGLGMSPSETIREYVARVGLSLSRRVLGVFEELSLMYERWLYGHPIKVDLESIKVLASSITEKQDEE